mmetsp:Transcript_4282/g.6570  ORF Transcript_4282/g.6570 Transcript_4282/m.6570 type:complete len:505 (+) Transcript_4282:69-1583(+)
MIPQTSTIILSGSRRILIIDARINSSRCLIPRQNSSSSRGTRFFSTSVKREITNISKKYASTSSLSILTRSSTDEQHTVILGCGIAGLSVAHYLLAAAASTNNTNMRVTVLDQHPGPAMGTSRKNGQLLCPSLSYSWVAMPILFGKDALLRSLINSTIARPFASSSTPAAPPVTMEPRALFDPKLWQFGMQWFRRRFIQADDFRNVNQAIGSLMHYTMKCLDDEDDELVQRISYDRVALGTQLLDGTVHTSDSSGDIGIFCTELQRLLVDAHGDRIDFIFGEGVSGVHYGSNDGSITDVTTTKKRTVSADQFVVALGTGSTDFCQSIGVPCPVYPVKGYLVTFKSQRDVPYNLMLPSKAFCAPMGGGKYRLSGFADFVADPFAKDCLEVDQDRAQALIEVAKKEFPDLEVVDIDCGFRPLSPDDCPLIGPSSKYQNLFYCTGHGSKGWSMGLGSGKLLTDIMLKKETSIDAKPYLPNRFDLGRTSGIPKRKNNPLMEQYLETSV